MLKDIRSYFQVQKSQKRKLDEDDDVIPESPEVQIKFKKKESKKKRVLKDSDSEEEILTLQQKKAVINKKTKITSKSSKPALKEVKAVDIFGSTPIKRTEPLIKKRKKTETGIHSDDEFEKSLLEIDNDELESKIVDKFKNEPGTNSVKQMPTSSNSKEKDKTINKDTTFKENKNKSIDSDSRKDTKVSDMKSPKEESNGIKKIGIKEEVKLNNKRKFSEFVENDVSNVDNSGKKNKMDDVENANNSHSLIDDIDCSVHENHEVKEKKNKSKINKSLNDSVLSDEERHERRRYSAALYKNYMNRSGPKHLGSKEIPEGAPNCLKDCAFVLTGVLDSFEKDDIAAAINKHGGIVKTGVTKKVTHVIAGEDAGPAKMAKAQELGIKIINEDEFLKMIVDLSSKKSDDKFKNDIKKDKSPIKKSSKEKINTENKSDKHNHINNKTSSKSLSKSNKNEPKSSNYKNRTDLSDARSRTKSKSPRKIKEEIKSEYTNGVKSENNKSCSNDITKSTSTADDDKTIYSYMWVDKYKPQNLKQIIGQHGDASNVKKLTNWLTKWYLNRKAKLTKPNPWAKNDDGGYYKAALLSGPPGVGKTTTVALVCKELGFDTVEFNASDTRNKTLIKEQIGKLLTTTSLSAYAKGGTGKQAVTKKHVLVMDEVDGMAGNEDRGGLQELIGLIKSTSVPIICMCNDRNSQKMLTLVNYCYDLRFQRPRVNQIKSAMMSICFKEGIKIPPDLLSQLIVSANQDVRQTLNFLSMWAADPELGDVERLRKDAKSMKRDVKLGPWEAIRKVFSAEEHKTMSINDKNDLFFYDYSLAPLFVQENYLQVEPHCPKHEVLQRLSKAADSISLGDMVDARIRGNQAWSLLPIQAMYSSVIPGNELSGHVTGQIQFPGWLGKNSRATKLHRLCQEIHAHTRLSTSGSKSSIYLDYCTHLRDAIVNPLIKDKIDGISQSLEVLESYHLLREDLDSLVELSVWPGQRNPTVLIDAKVKAAMTRTYNKKAVALPYAPGPVKRGRARDDDGTGEEGQYEEHEPEDSDPENDALIKKKKDKDTEKATTSKSKSSSKASTSKEKKKK